jgi:hypothetical protein
MQLVWSGTHGAVLGGGSGDGALRAAVAGVSGVTDGDLVGGWRRSLGVGSGQNWQNKSSEFGMHLEELMSESGGRPSEWWIGSEARSDCW